MPKNGFWHVTLNEESSYATTFGTPWGRYRWLRMPFGISPAPEEFQRRLDQALTSLDGAKPLLTTFLCLAAEQQMKKQQEIMTRTLLDS